MWQAQILTPFSGAGTADDPFRPHLAAHYPALAAWADVTGAALAGATAWPPTPNLYVVEVLCEASVLDAIEGDGRYQIISAEEVAALAAERAVGGVHAG